MRQTALIISFVTAAALLPCYHCYDPLGAEGTIEHFQQSPVLVTLYLKYESSCSSLQDVTIGIVQLPVDTLMLSVLEHASFAFGTTLSQFEVIYLHQLGYYVVSINGLAATNECRWTMSTNPPISLLPVHIGPGGTSLNNMFVSNYGMEITLEYESVGSASNYVPIYDLLSGEIPWHIVDPPMNFINNPLLITYAVNFPIQSTCPKPPNIVDFVLVNISAGQTALNVIESGAESDPNLTFTLHNWLGLFYSVRSINTAVTSASCQWCIKYSPTANESVPSYLLQVAPNDFVIPVDGGKLTLEYTDSCNQEQNDLNTGKIDDNVWLGSRQRHKYKHHRRYDHESIGNTSSNYGISYSMLTGILGIVIGCISLAVNVIYKTQHSKIL